MESNMDIKDRYEKETGNNYYCNNSQEDYGIHTDEYVEWVENKLKACEGNPSDLKNANCAIVMLTESNTFTFTTTDNCLHENYTFRNVTVNFYLFELTMLFKVCHNCHKLIKDHKKWKIKIN